MKLSQVPASARFLDVDGIPVVVLPDASCIAFEELTFESRPYPNATKAGTDGDLLSRESFAEWIRTGVSRFAVRRCCSAGDVDVCASRLGGARTSE